MFCASEVALGGDRVSQSFNTEKKVLTPPKHSHVILGRYADERGFKLGTQSPDGFVFLLGFMLDTFEFKLVGKSCNLSHYARIGERSGGQSKYTRQNCSVGNCSVVPELGGIKNLY